MFVGFNILAVKEEIKQRLSGETKVTKCLSPAGRRGRDTIAWLQQEQLRVFVPSCETIKITIGVRGRDGNRPPAAGRLPGVT